MEKILEYLLRSLQSESGVLETTFCATHVVVVGLYGADAIDYFLDFIEYRAGRCYLKNPSQSIDEIIQGLKARL